jgi:hypothetical protein
VLTLPLYLLEILVEYLPALDAHSMQNDIVVALAPHMEADDRSSLMDRLDGISALLLPEPPQVVIERHDPEAAKAYFESLGIRTT